MQQIRDPIQIKKFINGQHPILILEHQLIYNQSTIHFPNQLIDAIQFHDSIILLFQEQVSLFNPQDNTLTNKLTLKQHSKKRPYKLFYCQNSLFICDYIKGVSIFDINTQKKIKQKIDGKVLLIQEQFDSINILYQDREQNLIIKQLNNGKEIKTNIMINCKQLILTEHLLITYSYKSLKIYGSNFQEIADYSNLITEIVQVHEIQTNEFLIIQTNGSIQLLTLDIQTKKVNHIELTQLPHNNIFLSHLSNNKELFVVSQYGLSVYDQNFKLKQEEEFKYFMSKIFEFKDNLYVTKNYLNNSKLFQIKPIRKPINKSTKLNLNLQKEIIKQIYTKFEYIIVVTNSRIILYKDQELDQFQFQSQKQIEIGDYLILSDNQQILLLTISDLKLVVQDKLQKQTTIIRKENSQQFSVYTNTGYIEFYDIIDFKICLNSQSQQYLDISAYNINSNTMVISHYNNILELFQINDESQRNTDFESQQFELKSIAIQIDFTDQTYYIITQTGQFYTLNNNLQLIQLLHLFGSDALVEQIYSFNNEYLVQSFQNDKIRYFYYVQKEEAEIVLEHEEQMLMDNQGNLFTYHNQQIKQIQELTKPEFDILDTTLFQGNKEQIHNIKYDILITDKFIYQYQFDSFQQIYQIQGTLTSADIQENTIALLINSIDIIILKARSNKCTEIRRIICDKNHQLVKLLKDVLITTSFNEVNLYSLKSNKKLESFKAIFPDKKVYEENQILQIHVEFHNDTQLMIDFLIDQAGIVVVLLKILNNGENQEYKLSKKYHSPINMCQYTRMQMIQNTWETFNTFNQCHTFKQVQFFFDGCLKQITEKPTILQDVVVDSILYQGMIYYLGVAGALWKQLL